MPPILLSPHRDPSRRAGSLVLGCGARHVRGADAFEREAVARALIDDAAQLLGECDPGVAAGERRRRGDRAPRMEEGRVTYRSIAGANGRRGMSLPLNGRRLYGPAMVNSRRVMLEFIRVEAP